jgi:hypothetical protein
MRRRLLWIGVASVSILILAIVVLIAVSRPVERFVWLTPSQAEQMAHPQPPSKIVAKLKSWIAPILRRIQPAPPIVYIDTIMVPFSPDEVRFTTTNSPVATNANGMRAWVMSPSDWDELQGRLISILGNSPFRLGRPNFDCPAGARAEFTSRINTPANLPAGAIQMEVDMIPKDGRGTIPMDVSFVSTEWPNSPTMPNWSFSSSWPPVRTNSQNLVNSARPPALRTNYVVACRAQIPDGGALLIQCGNLGWDNKTPFWFIASPTTNLASRIVQGGN